VASSGRHEASPVAPAGPYALCAAFLGRLGLRAPLPTSTLVDLGGHNRNQHLTIDGRALNLDR
jgi:hypothetical protein